MTIAKKWCLIDLSREKEETAGREYMDLIFTLVLGVRDLSNPGFSCRKWTVGDVRHVGGK